MPPTATVRALLAIWPGLVAVHVTDDMDEPTYITVEIVVGEIYLALACAPAHTTLTPLTKGTDALAVIVMVSLPTGSGFGVIAISVGPGGSGLAYMEADILEFAVEVAEINAPFAGTDMGAV